MSPAPPSALPMTVIGGYLGSGKTTLINQILKAPHGRRLMVMVNDFGAINIDADLLHSVKEDTLTLTNGCVCCTMGADLFLAIGDALDRSPRPDHLIIEASGIADPQKIANVAFTEPDLSYSGIVTVVDAKNFAALQEDPQICAQIEGQVSCADFVLVSKTPSISQDLGARLERLTAAKPILIEDSPALTDLVLSDNDIASDTAEPKTPRAHPSYFHWTHQSHASLSKTELLQRLACRPKALYRIKGFVQANSGQGWVVHCVGNQTSLEEISRKTGTTLVGIGLAEQTTSEICDIWWASAEPIREQVGLAKEPLG